MTAVETVRRLLLISNSTLYGSGYLDHVEAEIKAFLGSVPRTVFIPFAVCDRRAYTEKAQERFRTMGLELKSIHDVSNMERVVEEADSIFVGGGNTFRLLKGLYDCDLIAPIRESVASVTPYIGSSAGSVVACPSLKTTKDMPVVQPPSFEALSLVPFQLSPHYLDPDPSSTHMGENSGGTDHTVPRRKHGDSSRFARGQSTSGAGRCRDSERAQHRTNFQTR